MTEEPTNLTGKASSEDQLKDQLYSDADIRASPEAEYMESVRLGMETRLYVAWEDGWKEGWFDGRKEGWRKIMEKIEIELLTEGYSNDFIKHFLNVFEMWVFNVKEDSLNQNNSSPPNDT
ncbi:MAG: hypothetical protein LBS60_13590 [Deltaproteobacteria bacterium]|jgi:hypothetical protein|nr:hypothetical protein [Deltaproteobacteria bacterium]